MVEHLVFAFVLFGAFSAKTAVAGAFAVTRGPVGVHTANTYLPAADQGLFRSVRSVGSADTRRGPGTLGI